MLLSIDTFVFWILKTVVSVAIGGALVERIIVVFDVDDLAWYSKVVGGCWDVHGEGLLTVASAPVTDPFSTWPCVVKMSRPVTDSICNWLWVVSMTSDPDEVDVDGRKSPVMKRKVKSIIWYPATTQCDYCSHWYNIIMLKKCSIISYLRFAWTPKMTFQRFHGVLGTEGRSVSHWWEPWDILYVTIAPYAANHKAYLRTWNRDVQRKYRYLR